MPIIDVQNLTYIYFPGTPYEKKALDNISLQINKGEFLGLIGANGSGKTTLVQHFNGLLTPTAGHVIICGRDGADKHWKSELWKKVGLVMQYPEQQIFEATVFEDVSYGPRNMGLAKDEVTRRTLAALEKVGLEPAIADQPPFCLSGGLRRRVAIAGVLAINPEILILDEPTAGLDPVGREMILRQLKQLQQANQTTIIMISHNLTDVISVADRLAVLAAGKLLARGDIRTILGNPAVRNLPYIGFPDYLRVIHALAAKDSQVNTNIYSLTAAANEIDKFLRRRHHEKP